MTSAPIEPFEVLVLDDDRGLRAVARHALSPDKYKVTEAGRIAEAKKLIAAKTFDLLVCDGLLPDGSGVDLLRELRKDGHQMAVVFLSSFYKDLATYKQLKDELGVADVLHKPIAPDALEERVRHALASAKK